MSSPETLAPDSPAAPETNSIAMPVPEAQDFVQPFPVPQPLRLPTLRTTTEPPGTTNMTTSSTPLGALNAARRPPPSSSLLSVRGSGLPSDMQAKMKAFHESRRGAPPVQTQRQQSFTPSTAGQVPSGAIGGNMGPTSPKSASAIVGPLVGGIGGLQLPPNVRPSTQHLNSAPAIPNARLNPKMGLAAKRGLNRGMKLTDATGPPAPSLPLAGADGANTNGIGDNSKDAEKPQGGESAFSKYSQFVDTTTGTLKFPGKATIDGEGINFSSGSSFKISLDEVDTLDELGKGNYGTVYKVRHSRPHMRRPGQGLVGNKAPSQLSSSSHSPTQNKIDNTEEVNRTLSPTSRSHGNTTGMVMAMKEIRLELDEAKFAAIIMELDVLHRCTSPFIIDFYGAFFQEGAVYICMEYMDGGSIDKLYGDGMPENVLRKIALSTVMGLKALKDEHNIIHRDVKPTNILVNSRGQVKICDFGVSGNLVASIAKTNIGCQSYMAPERISGGGMSQAGTNPSLGTYSVQSDIWSLGLSIIECAMGRYPYPPETYNNIFSQLSAIVEGDPPDLPSNGFSSEARSFVSGCLNKVPKLRPTYDMLIRHAWLAPLLKPPTITEEDEDEEDEEAESTQLEQSTASLNLDDAGPRSNGAVDITGINAAPTADKEVAAWVIAAMERRRNGTMGKSLKPALHAVALDAVPSPKPDGEVMDGENGMCVAASGD